MLHHSTNHHIMFYNNVSKLCVAVMILFVFLYCIAKTSAHPSKAFVMYEDQGPVSASAAVTMPASSRPLFCHSACLRRETCLSFSKSSTTCSLYNTYIDDEISQLHTQSGQVFYNISPKEKVSVTTEDASSQNAGWANFYPQLRINRAGRVLRWQVRCAGAGIVVLSIWRGEIAPNVTKVKTITADQSPEGEPIGLSFGKLLYDNDLANGTTIVIEGLGNVRAPSLVLYIG